jgi:hypothetical protein
VTRIDWTAINRAQDKAVAALKRLEGTHLKEVTSELHAANHEMPIWVLLFDAPDIETAHLAIRAALAPQFKNLHPITCTIVYLVLTDSEEIQVDFLEGQAEIVAAPEKRPLGARPMRGPRLKGGMFESVTSAR